MLYRIKIIDARPTLFSLVHVIVRETLFSANL